MKRNIGNLFIITCVLLTVAVWFVFPPENDGRANFERAYAGEIIGSINIVLMAAALFLSTRPKWAEPYFGGLDKMYVTHRRVATAAFLLGFYISFNFSRRARKLLYTMDIVHIHHPFQSGNLALRYCRPRSIPIVFTNHTHYDLYAQAYLPFLPESIGETAMKAYLPVFCRGV